MNTPHFWQLILGTVVALLPVINPVDHMWIAVDKSDGGVVKL